LIDTIGVQFTNVSLLERALTHSSFSNEHPEQPDNERLEFLGDSVLGAVVSDMLWRRYPDSHEGQLTRYKAILVQEQGLLPIAERLSLGSYLRLGKGEEQTGGREKASVLSDAVEAVVAAIYLDQGFEPVQQVIEDWYAERLQLISRDEEHTDHKTKLQEWAQSAMKLTPTYTIVSTEGPAHDREYTAEVYLDGTCLGQGQGRSKKVAEQAAAKIALSQRANHDKDVA
jgi:ribonuclease-3